MRTVALGGLARKCDKVIYQIDKKYLIRYHCRYADLITCRAGALFGSSALRDTLPLSSTKAPESTKEQRESPLFFCSPNSRRPRISAEKEMSMTDNLLQKQRKQRKGDGSEDSAHRLSAPTA